MARKKLVEAVAETDEDLMMKYLEGEEITEEELVSRYPSSNNQR